MNKKFYLFAAAAAVLSLTACSSDDDAVQSTNGAQTAAVNQAVSFDTYTASATRAGDPVGVLTTDKMKTPGKGFGVFAMFQDNVGYTSTLAPDFMFNEHVHWASGWTYSPLKYWPNETTKDSQTPNAKATECDKVSFFAYAPYVDLSAATGTMETNRTSSTPVDAYVGSPAETAGILSYTKEDRANDPLVEWAYSTDLDQNVDLLWGVAPAGMAYQSVNPDIYVDKTFGLPLTDMVKPDKDQKIKFLFQHALSRIGLSVVSAIDQIAAGDDGNVYNNAQTRVLIKSVEVYGNFGKQGVLNLNNASANTANWITNSIDKSSVSGSALYSFTVANGAIAKDLRYENLTTVTGAANAGAAATAFAALNKGVLPSEQTLLAGGADPSKEATDLTYAVGKKLYTKSGNDYVRATTTSTSAVDVFKKVNKDWVQIHKAASGNITLNGDEEAYYTLGETIVAGDVVGAAALGTTYFIKTTDGAGLITYTKHAADGSESSADGKVYVELAATLLAVNDYTGTCYTELTPRYFMVIPTGATPIKVKITYAVVTYDSKLGGYCSDVENDITKETSLTLESGKSYNLKLILGLTSVKLDATVADWQVADELEINLPRNNE